MPTIKKHLKSLLGEIEFNAILKLELTKEFKEKDINQKISIQSNFNDSNQNEVASTSKSDEFTLKERIL